VAYSIPEAGQGGAGREGQRWACPRDRDGPALSCSSTGRQAQGDQPGAVALVRVAGELMFDWRCGVAGREGLAERAQPTATSFLLARSPLTP
jgi:hypothetical protein